MSNLAFLVGCEEYDQENIDNLLGVNDDVISMQNALINYCGCSHEHVYTVTSQPDSACEPIGTKIIDLIIQKSNEYGDEAIDNLFFYFSGHGYLSAQNKVHLLLKDSRISPIIFGDVEVTAIIRALKQFVNVNHIILFLDICQNELKTKGCISNEIIPAEYFPQGVIIFFSCFPQNASYMIPQAVQDKYGRGSVFTKCLVEALQPQNECCNVKDISAYLKKEVMNLSRQLGFEQKPYTQIEDVSLHDVIISTDSYTDLGGEERNVMRNLVFFLMDNRSASSYMIISSLLEKKITDTYNSFLEFKSKEAKTDINKLASDINQYLQTLKDFKIYAKASLKYCLAIKVRPRYLVDLEDSTVAFLKIITNHITIISSDIEVIENNQMMISNYMKEFNLCILCIKSALKKNNKGTKEDVMNIKIATMESQKLIFEEINTFISDHKNILTYCNKLLQSLSDQCTRLLSKFSLLFNTQSNINEFIFFTDKIIYNIKHFAGEMVCNYPSITVFYDLLLG